MSSMVALCYFKIWHKILQVLKSVTDKILSQTKSGFTKFDSSYLNITFPSNLPFLIGDENLQKNPQQISLEKNSLLKLYWQKT